MYTLTTLLKLKETNKTQEQELAMEAYEKIQFLCAALALEPKKSYPIPKKIFNEPKESKKEKEEEKKPSYRKDIFGTKATTTTTTTTELPKRNTLLSEELQLLQNKQQLELLRSNLNKLTDSNFKEIKHDIFSSVHKTLSQHQKETAKNISKELFEIASNNRFYSKLYASLFAEFMDNYSIIHDHFQDQFSAFKCIFQKNQKNEFQEKSSIENQEKQESSYDELCRITKINEQRKALTCFFMNLMELGKIPVSSIAELLRNMFLELVEIVLIPEKKEILTNEVYQLSEIIALFWTSSVTLRSYLTDKASATSDKNILLVSFLEKEYTVSECISFFAYSCNSKTYPNFTKKCTFKFMDMLDITKK
jgi:hypothetical protein